MTEQRRALFLITGAYDLGGGIAKVNRLTLQATHDLGYRQDVVAYNEAASEATAAAYRQRGVGRYFAVDQSQARFLWHTYRLLLTGRYAFVMVDHVNLASILAPFTLVGGRYTVWLFGLEVQAEMLTARGRLGMQQATLRIAISSHTEEIVRAYQPELSLSVCDLSLESHEAASLADAAPQPLSFEAIDGQLRPLGEQVILIVGRLDPMERYKGHDQLIAAMPQVLAAHPGAQLVIVGRGDDADRLRSLALAHPPLVQARIFFTGFVNDADLNALYASCAVFAMPSRGEGFGLVYLEAMRYAKPCIGSRVDAARTVIVDEETGLLVDDPTDVAQVAETVVRLLDDPAWAAQLGQAGRARLDANYQYEHFRERFAHVIATNFSDESGKTDA